MTTAPAYSTLAACLYDEQHAIGKIGRGVHYSVFRTVEWLDVVRAPLRRPEIHDFAVIWDEDHDTRVIEAVEAIYMAGLWSPVQFIGEHKGMLTVIVAARFYWHSTTDIQEYTRQINELAASLPCGDVWPVEVGMFDRSPSFPPIAPHQTELLSLIADDSHKAVTYLRNIDALWSLGTKLWKPGAGVTPWTTPPV